MKKLTSLLLLNLKSLLQIQETNIHVQSKKLQPNPHLRTRMKQAAGDLIHLVRWTFPLPSHTRFNWHLETNTRVLSLYACWHVGVKIGKVRPQFKLGSGGHTRSRHPITLVRWERQRARLRSDAGVVMIMLRPLCLHP